MSNSPSSITVGCRVETTDSPPKSGVVVEDFGDLAGEDVVIDSERTAHEAAALVRVDYHHDQAAANDPGQPEPESAGSR